MRVLVCAQTGVSSARDIEALVQMQEVDGGWPGGWLYQYSSGTRIGNRGLTTAFAIAAIERGRAEATGA